MRSIARCDFSLSPTHCCIIPQAAHIVLSATKGRVNDSLPGDVAVAAFGYSVWVVVGESLLLLAGIEAEHIAGVALCRLFTE